MRHHNQVAYKLSEVNPQWNDDRVYEEARKIVGAQLQHVVYNEYLPKVATPLCLFVSLSLSLFFFLSISL